MDTATILQVIAAFIVTAFLIAITAVGITLLWPGATTNSGVVVAAQIITPFILAATLVALYGQISHIRDQNELQRAVVSKGAIQELNKILLNENQEDFLRFVFPHTTEKEARQVMMAFSLMNSLEMLYLARDKEADREEFKRLLHGFTKSVRPYWSEEFAAVYHPEFQKIVEEVFEEMKKEES